MVQGTPLVQGLKCKGSFEELKGDIASLLGR